MSLSGRNFAAAEQIVQQASKDPKFMTDFQADPVGVLRAKGFEIPEKDAAALAGVVRSEVIPVIPDSAKVAAMAPGATPWGCAGCKLGIGAAAIALVAALIAIFPAGVASAAALMAQAGAAITAFAATAGISAGVVGAVLAASGFATVSIVLDAICKSLKAC